VNVKEEGEENAQDKGLLLMVGGGLEGSEGRGVSLTLTFKLTTGEEGKGEEEEEDAAMVEEGRSVDRPCAEGGVSRALTNKNRFPLTSSLDS
jgi:hypothetical protein